MGGRWHHPIHIVMGILVAGLGAWLFWDFFCSIVIAMNGSATWDFVRKDLPSLLAGIFWVMIFSFGTVFCLVNLSFFFRDSVGKPKNYDIMKDLDNSEQGEIDYWLNTHIYDSEDLKKLWGIDSNV
jgi:hypothetical protein